MSPVPAKPILPSLAPGAAAALIAEVEAYLAAVDAFHAEGRAVAWYPERPGRPKRRRPTPIEKGPRS